MVFLQKPKGVSNWSPPLHCSSVANGVLLFNMLRFFFYKGKEKVAKVKFLGGHPNHRSPSARG